MKKIKLIMLGIMVAGTMTGCTDKTTVDANIEVTKTTEAESTTQEETSTVEETTTIEETTVAEAASIDETLDDVTYNTEMLKAYDIKEESAHNTASYINKIGFGRINAICNSIKNDIFCVRIVNKDGLVYYLVNSNGTLIEIRNEVGEYVSDITDSSAEDDVTYNTDLIKSFGIREDDAKAAAEFLDRISFGKIDASRRDDKSASPRYEISNSDGIVYYLVIKDDTIKEILNVKGEFIITITEEPAPVETPNTTDNQSSPNGEAPVEQSENKRDTVEDLSRDDGPKKDGASLFLGD